MSTTHPSQSLLIACKGDLGHLLLLGVLGDAATKYFGEEYLLTNTSIWGERVDDPRIRGLWVWTGTCEEGFDEDPDTGEFEKPESKWTGEWRPATAEDLVSFGFGLLGETPI